MNVLTTLHPLAPAEQAAETTLLAAIAHHFSAFGGPLRDAYEALTEQTPLAADVAMEEVDDGLLRGWWLRPPGAPAGRAILFLHGGAYMLGSARGYRGFASQIAARAGVAAFVLDYPLAPAFPFPAAIDATHAARRWLAGRGVDQLALVGDSAGGALALASLDGAACAVVFSPWVDLTLSGASTRDPATHDPIFQRQVLANAAAAYLQGAPADDGRASPLFALPASLPPIAIQVGTDELLLDDARRYATAAAARGGIVHLDVYAGLHHVFQRSVTELASARHALDAAARFIDAHWPAQQAIG